jgi:hypothetical protein
MEEIDLHASGGGTTKTSAASARGMAGSPSSSGGGRFETFEVAAARTGGVPGASAEGGGGGTSKPPAEGNGGTSEAPAEGDGGTSEAPAEGGGGGESGLPPGTGGGDQDPYRSGGDDEWLSPLCEIKEVIFASGYLIRIVNKTDFTLLVTLTYYLSARENTKSAGGFSGKIGVKVPVLDVSADICNNAGKEYINKWDAPAVTKPDVMSIWPRTEVGRFTKVDRFTPKGCAGAHATVKNYKNFSESWGENIISLTGVNLSSKESLPVE